MPLNIDHWIIHLWDQLNFSISQGFRYKPRGGQQLTQGGRLCPPPPPSRLTPAEVCMATVGGSNLIPVA